MTDYNLGTAKGKIEIDYEDTGIKRAVVDLDKATDASDDLDESLTRTNKTLDDSKGQFNSAGTAAAGYRARLQDVRNAASDLKMAENDYHKTLLDERSTLTEVERAHERVTAAKKEHEKATHAARDASAALNAESNIGARVMRGLSDAIPNLGRNISRLATLSDDAEQKTNALSRGLSGIVKVIGLLGPEGRIAAGGIELVSKAIENSSDAASSGGQHLRDFVKDVAGFEVAFGKISGLSLGIPALGGLAGIGGAAGIQGIIEVVEAVRQLSGALGLLPAVVGGVGAVMGTLKIAFHGVGDAIKDMMADDPKKFLQDIANMGPAAAHSMLQIAQFRDQFLAGGAAIQDSFFTKIANDIAPLVQTWLPALVRGGSQIAGVLGQAADSFAKLLMQPQAMAAFTAFTNNISKGLYALQPAIAPLLDIFTQLSVVGSSFFVQIGTRITEVIQFFGDLINKAAASGELQQWIQTAINAFLHLGNAVYSFGSAFNTIMNIADQFGGGGLLGFIDKISLELQNWTQSEAGQKALVDFFSTVRTATDAFLPMLGPLLSGLVSIGQAFVQLGVATAPAWLEFFKTFAYEMSTDLGPAIQGMGPAISTFLAGMTDAFRQLMQTLGPQLPQIFQDLANAFVALVPQIPQIAALFANLVQAVGPELPGLFHAVTEAIQALIPLMPQITTLVGLFIDGVTLLVQVLGGLVDGAKAINDVLGKDLPKAINGIADMLGNFFSGLPDKALQWGKDLIQGFIDGIKSLGGGAVNAVTDVAGDIIGGFKDLLGIHSPSRVFHDLGLNTMQGLGAGLMAGAGPVISQTKAIAQQLTASMSGGLAGISGAGGGTAAATGGGGRAGAPAAGGAGTEGGSLLPPWIASADTSILSRYLQHEFPKNRGLAGFAADMGKLLSAFQGGFNLLMQHGLQPIGQVMGMIPGLNAPTWTKMSPQQIAEKQQQDMARRAAGRGPTWTDVLGKPAAPGDAEHLNPAGAGGGALVDALKAKGFSPQQIRLIQAFSQVEGNNPAGNPTLGFTDAQLGGASDLQSHVDALAKQFIDRASVAGAFPEGGTDEQQAQWIAKVVGQSGLSSDWQGNAQPQDYVQRVMRAMGPLPGAANPSWPQVTGGGTPGDAQRMGAPGAYPGDAALLANVPAGRYLQTQAADLTKGIGDCSSAVEDLINMMDGVATAGRQMATGNADKWLTAHGFLPTDKPVPGAFQVGFSPSHMQATLPGGTPFNWGSDAAAAARGIGGTGAWDPSFTSHYYRPAGPMSPQAAAAAAAGYPDVANALDQIKDNTGKGGANDQLLQAYLRGNPALAAQIDAAKTPGASDQQVMGALNGISTTISGLKAQDAVGNKNTIDALQSTQNQLAQNAGFQQGQSPAQMFQSAIGSASNVASSIIQAIQSGLDALTATQDIADRLVYGVRNTEDINKLIDDVQKYITFAANVSNAVGSILSAVGAAGSGSGGMDMGASGAISAAGQIAQLIAGVLQGVNAAIDFGQQVYHIAGQYVGRFLSVMTGLHGTPLMGDVRLQLNKNTGDLIAYSEDNPENKDVMKVPSWMNQTYDYGSGQNPNPQVNNQFNIWGGVGQSAGDLLSASAWMVATSGTTGAMAESNF